MKYLVTLAVLFASVLSNAQVPQSLHSLPLSVNSSSWSAFYGQVMSTKSAAKAPDGTSVMYFVVSVKGGIILQQDLPQILDLSRYDSFSFYIAASATRIGDFVYLVDVNGRRRWFPLILRSTDGWRQPVYSINKYTNQDDGFDITHIKAIRFGQSGQIPGDNIWVGNVAFTNNTVANPGLVSTWSPDIGRAIFGTATDSPAGRGAIKAILVADAASAPGQADLAINGLSSRIHWDWTNKKYIQFYYKAALPPGVHQYFYWGIVCSLTDPNANSTACSCNHLTCTINGAAPGSCDSRTCRSYREYIFDSPENMSGQWLKISADLDDPTAYTVGLPALSDVNWFEVGVFNGLPNAQYTLEIGPVAVYK